MKTIQEIDKEYIWEHRSKIALWECHKIASDMHN